LFLAIARNISLEELNLDGCQLQAQGVVMNIAFGLRLNQNIRTLTLDSCYLEDEEVSQILVAVEGHPTLTKLSLQRNSCHTKGMAAIATLLHNNQLQHLDLSFLVRQKKKREEDTKVEEEEEESKKDENDDEEEAKKKDTTDDDDGDDTKKDDDGDKQDKKKKKDDEKDNDDQDDDQDDEGEIEVQNTSLQTLLLAGNGVSDAFLESVMGIFGKESQLQELNLFGNRLSSKGISKYVLKRLQYLQKLERLWIGHNTNFDPLEIQDELLHGVRRNYSLQEISIKGWTDQSSPELIKLQGLLDHYTKLNCSGRRIMVCFDERDTNTTSFSAHNVPLGLWPLILERSHRMYPGDGIFCLLHGPVLFENLQ
jgi:Ran GTPase-activating protein (RanGAP) involved in mRNA processing and transport